MKRVYITLCGRVENAQDSPRDVGEVAIVDVDSGKLLQAFGVFGDGEVVIGRTRGAQGIDWYENGLVVGTRNSVSFFDPNTYEFQEWVTEGAKCLANGGHQVRAHGEELLSAITLDDRRGVVRDRRVVECLPVPLGRDRKDTLHFNSIAISPTNEEWHLYRDACLLYNFTTGERVHIGPWESYHDICFLDERRILVNGSDRGKLHLVDRDEQTTRCIFHRETGSTRGAYKVGYLRGIAYDKDSNIILVHRSARNQPQLFILDATNFQLLDTINYWMGETQAAFDLLLDPRDWEFDGRGYDGKSFKYGSER